MFGLSDCKKAPVWHPKYEMASNECKNHTKLLKGANFRKFMKVQSLIQKVVNNTKVREVQVKVLRNSLFGFES